MQPAVGEVAKRVFWHERTPGGGEEGGGQVNKHVVMRLAQRALGRSFFVRDEGGTVAERGRISSEVHILKLERYRED